MVIVLGIDGADEAQRGDDADESLEHRVLLSMDEPPGRNPAWLCSILRKFNTT
jgi:hypothetical protein